MIVCPRCHAGYEGPARPCPHCRFAPEDGGGYLIWPPVKPEPWHYDAESFEILDRHERVHFWFAARVRLITHHIRKYFPNINSLLDVGCGTGFVLGELSKIYPRAALYGADVFTESLAMAAKRLPAGTALILADALSLPYRREFDLVMACDVLEHIDDDTQALRKLRETVKPGGGLLITVPQHQWLWSGADEKAGHVRRYRPKELSAKARLAGWTILAQTSFVSLLLPVMAASRLLLKNTEKGGGESEFNLPPRLNQLFGLAMTAERALIKLGLAPPVGASGLMVARKDG